LNKLRTGFAWRGTLADLDDKCPVASTRCLAAATPDAVNRLIKRTVGGMHERGDWLDGPAEAPSNNSLPHAARVGELRTTRRLCSRKTKTLIPFLRYFDSVTGPVWSLSNSISNSKSSTTTRDSVHPRWLAFGCRLGR